MFKVAVVTSTRADYGILHPLIRKIYEEELFELHLLATGMHLSEEYGYTVREIEKDGFPIRRKIPILEEGNTPYDISVTMANAQIGFAKYFRDERPDMVVILGDRTEMLGIAAAAVNERIPIAHISGGEVTAGAVDESIRHSLTKMAYLHFPGTEIARKRVIQLGESPDRVYNVGLLSTENIRLSKLLSEEEIRKELGVGEAPYAIVTFHPVTQENATAEGQVLELCAAMDAVNDVQYYITMSNSDVGGALINQIFTEYASQRDNVRMSSSLGMKRYLSALKYAEFVLGNSSSGIGEAPIIGVPTVNIGDRQKGRVMAETVINCVPRKEEIIKAIQKARETEHIPTKIFGDVGASDTMVRIMKEYLAEGKIDLKNKVFYDVDFQL